MLHFHISQLLYTFECIVLMHFLKCLNNKRKAKKRSKDRAISSMSPPKDHAKIGLPIVVQQILQYPFFLFMKEIRKYKFRDSGRIDSMWHITIHLIIILHTHLQFSSVQFKFVKYHMFIRE